MATLSQLKYQLKLVDDPADANIQSALDAELERYLGAAVRQAEHDTGKKLSLQNCTEYFKRWSNELVLTSAPFHELVYVSYYPEGGTALQAVDNDLFSIGKTVRGAKLLLNPGVSLPALSSAYISPIVVEYRAGFEVDKIPEDIDSWILMRAAALYINRETDNNLAADPVGFADGLLDSERGFTI